MSDFTKPERKSLGELAAATYEAEVRTHLEVLDEKFARWRSGELPSSQLLDSLHEFNKDQARELWSKYQALNESQIVARGLALGFLSEQQVPESLREKLQSLVAFFSEDAS